MALKQTNKKGISAGFTIVELLIVIVVIAILATISIVAYSGVQQRAKTSAGKELASQVAKKFEIYFAINSAYPTTKTQIQGTSESKIEGVPAATTADTDGPLIVPNTDTLFSGTTLTGDTANGGQAVRVTGSATGGTVHFWDYTSGTGAEDTITYGAGS